MANGAGTNDVLRITDLKLIGEEAAGIAAKKTAEVIATSVTPQLDAIKALLEKLTPAAAPLTPAAPPPPPAPSRAEQLRAQMRGGAGAQPTPEIAQPAAPAAPGIFAPGPAAPAGEQSRIITAVPGALPLLDEKALQAAALFTGLISRHTAEETDFRQRRQVNYEALIAELASRRLRVDQDAEYSDQSGDYVRDAMTWLVLQMTRPPHWNACQAVDYAVEQGWTYELTYASDTYRLMMKTLYEANVWVRKTIRLDPKTEGAEPEEIDVLQGLATLIDTGQLDISHLVSYVRENKLVGRRPYTDDDAAIDKEKGEKQYPAPKAARRRKKK